MHSLALHCTAAATQKHENTKTHTHKDKEDKNQMPQSSGLRTNGTTPATSYTTADL